MNKRGFLGWIILGILVLIILVSTVVYFYVKSNGVQISSGNVKVEINFNDTNKVDSLNKTNSSLSLPTNISETSQVNQS